MPTKGSLAQALTARALPLRSKLGDAALRVVSRGVRSGLKRAADLGYRGLALPTQRTRGHAKDPSYWDASGLAHPGRPPSQSTNAAQGKSGSQKRKHERTTKRTAKGTPQQVNACSAPTKVSIIGADPKFITALAKQLDREPGLQVGLQRWPRWSAYPPLRIARQALAADVLVAEWTRQNAIWASRHKRPGQRLITRLHRFELESPYPAHIKADALDAVVYIAPLLGRRIRDELGWPLQRLVYLPNYVDLAAMDRPKYRQSQFRLGLAAAVPQRKRLDLALDVLAALRAQDGRYSLSVRMPAPWQVQYVARRKDELAYFSRCYQRIETDPLLRGAVSFDGFSQDVSSWLRGVGIVLSCADNEGNPVAVAEAMASGAVPLVRNWPGAHELLDPWVYSSAAQAVQAITELADDDLWWERSHAAKVAACRELDPARVVAGWAALLRGDLDAARAQFPAHQLLVEPLPVR